MSWSVRSAWRRAAIGVAGCSLSACSNDLSALYSHVPSDGGAVGLATLLPALPDESRITGCEECAKQRCADHLEACLQSERCKEMLDCKGRCSNPNCLVRCSDTLPRSVVFEDYFDCVYNTGPTSKIPSACSLECGAGTNWECAGNYAWDPREADVVTMEVAPLELSAQQISPFAFLPGVEIAPCNDFFVSPPSGDQGCEAGVPVDEYGVASVGLNGNQDAFAIYGGLGERHRVYPRPISRRGRLMLPVVARAQFLAIVAQDPRFDPTLGVVEFIQTDCTGVLAFGSVALSAPSAVGYTWTGAGKMDPNGAPYGVGYFINVPPAERVRITSTPPTPDLGSSSVLVVVAAGWLTDVQLVP